MNTQQTTTDTSALESIVREYADLLISQASTPEPYPGATTDERWGFWFDCDAWYGLALTRTARKLCGV